MKALRTCHAAKIGIAMLLSVGMEFGRLVTTDATASAQTVGEGLIGLWYGQIVPVDGEAYRLLGITRDGTCYWAVYSDPTKKKKVPWEKSSCKLDHKASKMELITSAKSKVALTLVDNDHLKGYIATEYHGGYTPRTLEMRRENPADYGIKPKTP